MPKSTGRPEPVQIPHQLEKHGDLRIDPYYWMRERDQPDVIRYLESENAYYEEQTADTRDLQQKLFGEYKSRIKEEDESVPYLKNGYWYQTLEKEGKEYPIYTRWKDGEQEVELLFDVNVMAEGFDFYHFRSFSVSRNNRWAAYGVDTRSRRIYTIRIKDLHSGEILPEELPGNTGRAVWSVDNRTLFYTRIDEQTLRPYRVYRHLMGTPVEEDELVYEEKDNTFRTEVYRTKSWEFLIIGSESTVSSEYRFLRADRPQDNFRLFAPRIRDLEYDLMHFGQHFYLLTNKDGARNFKLMRTPVDRTDIEHWEEVVPHREGVLLEDVELFRDYCVLCERNQGLSRLRVMGWADDTDYYIPMDTETYVTGFSANPNFESRRVRYYYNPMTHPASVLEYDMFEGKEYLLKQQEVPDPTFEVGNYRSERLWAQARDGVRVPISVVYHKDFTPGKGKPLLLYGYGSYGITIDPYFSTGRLSLLDRGFAFAIAHVRGGQYLGRQWYEDGKMLNKKNTFYDFIDCALYLIDQGYAQSEHLYAMGGSAGGLLMGAVINMSPGLFRGVIASVPFVDVLTTMLDDSIPLTTGEYDEWGNPNEPEYYHYIKSYSPYDNLKPGEYPHLLVTTGYHDSQVQYWEPAKWVARIRDLKTDSNRLLFHTQMETGHSGSSGRFESLKELAREHAFILDLEGIKE